jgi:enoyl-CoA hydratase/carnithine racemase
MSYETLAVRVEDGVAFVTLDHPPINLLDTALLDDLDRLTQWLQGNDEVRVVVFDSANAEYFVAHYDIEALLERFAQPRPKAGTPNRFHLLLERLRTLPQITIAQLAGRARGAGSEFALALDMRFASRERAILGQPEVALGILPGGTGTQRLPRLLGRARALEVILGARDVDAALAERYGWVNRALPDEELGQFVAALARRIASFPPGALQLAKRAVDLAELPLHDGLLEEAHLFAQLAASPDARQRMRAFLDAGGQTAEGEREIERLISAPAKEIGV